MPDLAVATHSGPFHADDVLALALIHAFHAPTATVTRTRDPARLAAADLVLDVGGAFDPARRRFDHHQRDYDGDRSSAGMILDWLQERGDVEDELARWLRADLVDHVDAVDNGRAEPAPGVPCFSTLIARLSDGAEAAGGFDAAYARAVAFAREVLQGYATGLVRAREARAEVEAAMAAAAAAGTRVLELGRYHKWQPAYFAHGGADHPSDYVLFPAGDEDATWRIVAIPPEQGSFDKKRALPASWAGLEGAELGAVVGVEGARFCHRNRFLAVFETREAAIAAIRAWGLDDGSEPCGEEEGSPSPR